jgi:putative heme iron utilization protein
MTITTTHGAADTSAHFAAGPAVVGDVTTFPSHAELARTLVEPGAIATLSTLTRDGHPYGSVVPISTQPGGSPLMCISEIAEHTRNLRRDPRASLLVTASADHDTDPLALARVTLIGALRPCEPDAGARRLHLDVHPHAIDYVGFDDFSWWRLDISSVRFIGGFGVMGWTSADEFAAATADPIIPHATPMIEHLNDDHADACLDIARRLAGAATATAAHVTAVDRYGMTFDAVVGDRIVNARVAFPAPLDTPDAVRPASIGLVRRARSTNG